MLKHVALVLGDTDFLLLTSRPNFGSSTMRVSYRRKNTFLMMYNIFVG